MNIGPSKTLGASRYVAVIGLAGVLLTISAGITRAESRESSHESEIVGTWAIQVTLRNCSTNDALGAPFNSVGTFELGGTSIGSTASLAFAAGQRTVEHGIWSHQRRRSFFEKIVALIIFDTPPNLPGTMDFNANLPVSPGLFTGWQTITHTITLSDDHHYTSQGTTAFYKADGTLYRSGCSTAIGRRFE